jgi:hypothetical protein
LGFPGLAAADIGSEWQLGPSLQYGTFVETNEFFSEENHVTTVGFDLAYTLYFTSLREGPAPPPFREFVQHPSRIAMAAAIRGAIKDSAGVSLTFNGKYHTPSRRWSTGLGTEAGFIERFRGWSSTEETFLRIGLDQYLWGWLNLDGAICWRRLEADPHERFETRGWQGGVRAFPLHRFWLRLMAAGNHGGGEEWRRQERLVEFGIPLTAKWTAFLEWQRREDETRTFYERSDQISRILTLRNAWWFNEHFALDGRMFHIRSEGEQISSPGNHEYRTKGRETGALVNFIRRF